MYTYQAERLSLWLKELLNTNECGTLVGLPGSGKNRTLQNAFSLLNKSDIYEVIDLSLPDESDKYLKDKVKKSSLSGIQYFLINHFSLNDPESLHKLNTLHSAREETTPKINFIYILQQDPELYISNIKHLSFTKKLLFNIHYFPYSNHTDFIENIIPENESRFNAKLSTSDIDKIWQLSGGCPYLVKVLIKQFTDNKKLEISQEFKVIITDLINRIDTKYINYLKKPKKNSPESLSLTKLGLVDPSTDAITSKLLLDLSKEIKTYQSIEIDQVTRKILINSIDVISKLTPKEKEILFALKSQKEVSREELAKLCFNSDDIDNYSDYSIDQTMSRLRRKIAKLGGNPNIIKTQKKHGYSLENTN